MTELPLIRNSERSSFKKCQAQWNWAWNEGLNPAMEKQDARWFGTGIHLALAEWYTPPGGKDGFTRGRHPVETWLEFSKGAYSTVSGSSFWDDEAEKEFYNSEKLGEAMLHNYLAKWGEDSRWEILMPETRFETNIPYTADQLSRGVPNLAFMPDGQSITKVVGTFDCPLRDHSYSVPRIVILDHKTTNKRESITHLYKDDQIGTYTATSTAYLRKNGLIHKDESVTECVFNYLRKAMPKDEEARGPDGLIHNKPQKKHYLERLGVISGITVSEKDSLNLLASIAEKAGIAVYGDVSKNQGVPLFWREVVTRNKRNRLRQVERIAEDAEQMAVLRAGLLPITKAPGEHCNWCDFNDLCDIDEDGGDTEGFISDVFVRRDVYADHREGARNSKESVDAKKETGQ